MKYQNHDRTGISWKTRGNSGRKVCGATASQLAPRAGVQAAAAGQPFRERVLPAKSKSAVLCIWDDVWTILWYVWALYCMFIRIEWLDTAVMPVTLVNEYG